MASETITACENICRDFSWLGEWIPALIAAFTALLIAFCAYPWQKKLDRELQRENELRASYREFVDEIFAVHRELLALPRSDTFDATKFPKELGRLLRRSDAALMRLGLEAKKDVIVEARQSVDQLYIVNRALKRSVDELEKFAEGGSTVDVRGLVEKTINARRDDLAQSLQRAVNSMRRDGFGHTDALKISMRSAVDD